MTNDVILREPTAEEIQQAKLPARYEAACTAIAECDRIDDLKDLADRQAALAAYARQAKDDSLLRLAQRIQARALRRAGELLKQIPDSNRGRPRNSGDARPNFGGWIPGHGAPQPSLEGWLPGTTRSAAAGAAGMTEHGKKTALRVASIAEADFEAAVESDTPPTVSALAMRGTVQRPQSPAPELSTADAALVSQAQSLLRELAAFAAAHDPVAIARSAQFDADAVRGFVATLDRWLDRLVTNLRADAA